MVLGLLFWGQGLFLKTTLQNSKPLCRWGKVVPDIFMGWYFGPIEHIFRIKNFFEFLEVKRPLRVTSYLSSNLGPCLSLVKGGNTPRVDYDSGGGLVASLVNCYK